MSVLYRALNKAARANEDRDAEPYLDDPSAAPRETDDSPRFVPPIGAAPKRRGKRTWLIAAPALIFMGGAIGATALYQDELSEIVARGQTWGGAPDATSVTVSDSSGQSAADADDPDAAPAETTASATDTDAVTEIGSIIGPDPGAAEAPAEDMAREPAASEAGETLAETPPPARNLFTDQATPGVSPETSASGPSAVQPPPGRDTEAGTPVAEAPPADSPDRAGQSGAAGEAMTREGDRMAIPPRPQQAARQTNLEETLESVQLQSEARSLAAPVEIDRGQRDLLPGDAVSVRSVSRRNMDFVSAGYAALVNGDYNEALGAYNEALSEEADNVLALLGKAAALHRLNRFEQARDAYEAVLQADPGNREALTNLLSLMSRDNPREALRRLRELEKSAPEFGPIPAQIGMLFATLGATEEAISYMSRAVALDPDNSLYLYNLAVVQDKAGQTREAVRSYQRLLTLLRRSGNLPSSIDRDAITTRLGYLRRRQ